MLKRSISADEYGKLAEPLQELYEKKGDEYQLKPPEGFVPEDEHKKKIGEFRDTNIEVMKERDALKKASLTPEQMEEYEKLRKEKGKAERDKLREEDRFEEWVAKHKAEAEAEKKRYEEKLAEAKKELERFKLDDKVRAAAVEAGVSKDSVEDVLALTRARSNFRLDGDDKIKVYDDDGAPVGGTPLEFFQGPFKNRRPLYFDGTGSAGSGTDQEDLAKGGGGDAGDGVRVVGGTQDDLNRNLEEIAEGKVVRQSA